MNNGTRQIIEGIELPNQERIRTVGEKENYNYLGMFEADTIKQAEMKKKKKKKRKEHHRRTRKLLKSKLYGRNVIKGINTCVTL